MYLDALRPAAEYDGNGALVSRFVYLSGRNVPDLMLKGTTAYRLLTDERGSVRLVVNAATGAVAQRLDYDEWGVAVDSNPGFQPFGFAGGMQDPTTKLVHFGARDYAPQWGRWTTKDPSGMAGGLNLYAYAAGDPIDYIDVDGHFWAPVVAVGVVLLGGALVQNSNDYGGLVAYGVAAGTGAALVANGAGAAIGEAASGVWARLGFGAAASAASKAIDSGKAAEVVEVAERVSFQGKAGQMVCGVDPTTLQSARQNLELSKLLRQRMFVANGVTRFTPIKVTEDGVVFDGNHGARAAGEVGKMIDVLVVSEVRDAKGFVMSLPIFNHL